MLTSPTLRLPSTAIMSFPEPNCLGAQQVPAGMLFLFLALFSPPLAAQSAGASPEITTVMVTGRGVTRWDARQDAIRQALQQALPQLVRADRAVRGDELVKDQVLSTMNGVVDRFEVLGDSTGKDGIVELHARVAIVPSRMNLYIRPGNKGASKIAVDGESMLADMQAVQLKAKATGSMLRPLYEGFPDDAVDASVVSVKPYPTGGQVEVIFEVRINPAFLAQLRAGLDAISETAVMTRCRLWDDPVDCADRTGFSARVGGKKWAFAKPLSFERPIVVNPMVELVVKAGTNMALIKWEAAGDHQYSSTQLWGDSCSGEKMDVRCGELWLQERTVQARIILPMSFFEDAKSLSVEYGDTDWTIWEADNVVSSVELLEKEALGAVRNWSRVKGSVTQLRPRRPPSAGRGGDGEVGGPPLSPMSLIISPRATEEQGGGLW